MGGQNFSYEDIFGGGGGFADIFSEIFGVVSADLVDSAVEAAEVVQICVGVKIYNVMKLDFLDAVHGVKTKKSVQLPYIVLRVTGQVLQIEGDNMLNM